MRQNQIIAATSSITEDVAESIQDVLVKMATAMAEYEDGYSRTDYNDYLDQYVEIAKDPELRETYFISPSLYRSLKGIVSQQPIPVIARLVSVVGTEVTVKELTSEISPSAPSHVIASRVADTTWEVQQSHSIGSKNDQPVATTITNAVFWYLELPNSARSWKAFNPEFGSTAVDIPDDLDSPYIISSILSLYPDSNFHQSNFSTRPVDRSPDVDSPIVPDHHAAEYAASLGEDFLAACSVERIGLFSYGEAGVIQTRSESDASALFEKLQDVIQQAVQDSSARQQAVIASDEGRAQYARQTNSPIRQKLQQRLESVEKSLTEVDEEITQLRSQQASLYFDKEQSRYDSGIRAALDDQRTHTARLQAVTRALLLEEEDMSRARQLKQEAEQLETLLTETVKTTQRLEKDFLKVAEQYGEIDHKISGLLDKKNHLDIEKQETEGQLHTLDIGPPIEVEGSIGYFQPYLVSK